MIPVELERDMAANGLKPVGNYRENSKGIIRFRVDGEKHDNGWIKLFDDGLGACYGSWVEGITYTWFANGKASQISKSDLSAIKEKRRKETLDAMEEAAKKAAFIQSKLTEATSDNGYIKKKGADPKFFKQYRDSLAIPIFNKDGKLCSFQFIFEDGNKVFLSDGEIEGCFSIIGWRKCGVLVVCEGYATGVTIHEATNLPVFVAFNGGNLGLAVKNIRQKVGNKYTIIIAADNDRDLAKRRPDLGNVGIKKAFDASKKNHCEMVYPIFREGENGSDFNDIGISRTRKIFERFL